MRTRKGHKTALLVAATGALFLGASTAQAANIVVGNGGAEANTTGTIVVTLEDQGEGVVGTLNDIRFEAGARIAEATNAETTLESDTGTGVDTGTSVVAETKLAAALDATTTTGNVAVVDASGMPDVGSVKIDAEVISYGSKVGNNLVLAGRGQIGTTAAAHLSGATVATVVAVADASRLPDFGSVMIDAEVISYGSKIGNNLVLAGRAQNGTTAAAHASGATVDPQTLPACQMSTALAALNKSAVFSFIPDGCDPGTDCEGVRGIVIALNNLGEIEDGTVLYTCTVAAGPTDGDFDLTCPAAPSCAEPPVQPCTELPFAPAQAAPPPDGALLDTTCASGIFTVGPVTVCVGDQDDSGDVSSAEATRAVLAFARRNKSLNPAGDADNDGSVSSAEATRSVLNFARRQCNP